MVGEGRQGRQKDGHSNSTAKEAPRVYVTLKQMDEVSDAITRLKQAEHFKRERVMAFIHSHGLGLGVGEGAVSTTNKGKERPVDQSSHENENGQTKLFNGSTPISGRASSTNEPSKSNTSHRTIDGKQSLVEGKGKGHEEGGERGSGGRDRGTTTSRHGVTERGTGKKGEARATTRQRSNDMPRASSDRSTGYTTEFSRVSTASESEGGKKIWQPGDPYIKTGPTDPSNVMRDPFLAMMAPQRVLQAMQLESHRERRRKSPARDGEPMEFGERSRDWGNTPDYSEDRHQGMDKQMYSDQDQEHQLQHDRKLWDPSDAFTRGGPWRGGEDRKGDLLVRSPGQIERDNRDKRDSHVNKEAIDGEYQPAKKKPGKGASGRSQDRLGQSSSSENEHTEEEGLEGEDDNIDEEEQAREYDSRRRRRAPRRRESGEDSDDYNTSEGEGENEEDNNDYITSSEDEEEAEEEAEGNEEVEKKVTVGKHGPHTVEEELARKEAQSQCHTAARMCEKLQLLRKTLQPSNTHGLAKMCTMATEIYQRYGNALLADPVYAHAKNVEHAIWQHGFYQNVEVYRRIIKHIQTVITNKQTEAQSLALQGWNSTVQQHYQNDMAAGSRLLAYVKAEFTGFLSRAIEFYQSVINQLQHKYKFRIEVREDNDNTGGGFSDNLWLAVKPLSAAGAHRHTNHGCFVSMGDLERYKQLTGDMQEREWATTARYYWCARTLAPRIAKPYNQLAVVAAYKVPHSRLLLSPLFSLPSLQFLPLALPSSLPSLRLVIVYVLAMITGAVHDQLFYAVYFYLRALAVKHPFLTARDSLTIIFSKVRIQAQGLVSSSPNIQDTQTRESEGNGKGASPSFNGVTETWLLADRRVICQDGDVMEVQRVVAKEGDGLLDSNNSDTRLADLGGPEAVMWRLTTHLLHIYSMFFTKIGMERLVEEQADLLEEIEVLLKEMYLSPGLLVQIVAMNICSIHDQPHAIDPTQVSVIQRSAVMFSAHMFSLMAKICVQCLNDPENGDSGTHLEIILPAVKLYCDWLSCPTASTLWLPVLLDARSFESCGHQFWHSLATLLNAVGQLITDQPDTVHTSNSPMRWALWEDRAIIGLVHVAHAHESITFDIVKEAANSTTEDQALVLSHPPTQRIQTGMRAQSIREVGLVLVAELEKFARVTRSQGAERTAQYAQGGARKYRWTEKHDWMEGVLGVVAADNALDTKEKFASRPCRLGGMGDHVTAISTNKQAVKNEERRVSIEDEERSQNGDGEEVDEVGDSDVAELRGRMTELTAALDLKMKQTEVIKAALAKQKTLTGLNMEITPAYVVFDTNCFVSHLTVVQQVVDSKRHTIVCPLVVINELYGLTKGTLIKPGADPIHVMAVKAVAQEAVQYLEHQFSRSNPHLRAMTTRGTMLTTIKFRTEADQLEPTTNDDLILQCCLHLVDPKQD
eukprot:Ihof_evm4s30 gene=Ihof_evmTU4s30